MKKQLSFAFLKHGAERSMDGLEQDAPATTEQPLLHPLYQSQITLPLREVLCALCASAFRFCKRQKKLDQMRPLHFIPQSISFAQTFGDKGPCPFAIHGLSHSRRFAFIRGLIIILNVSAPRGRVALPVKIAKEAAASFYPTTLATLAPWR
jgi:hypothetical protein